MLLIWVVCVGVISIRLLFLGRDGQLQLNDNVAGV